MGAGEINFLALPAVAVLALAGSPVAFRRAGFLWAKVVFGTLTVLFAALAVTGIIISIQHKTGLSDLPLAWLAVPGLAVVLVRVAGLRGRL